MKLFTINKKKTGFLGIGVVIALTLLLAYNSFTSLPFLLVHHYIYGIAIIVIFTILFFSGICPPVIYLIALGFGLTLIIDQIPNLITGDFTSPSLFISSR